MGETETRVASEAVAWRYRHRRETEWSFTEDAEKIERLRAATDDRDGRLVNERLPSWEVEPLYA